MDFHFWGLAIKDKGRLDSLFQESNGAVEHPRNVAAPHRAFTILREHKHPTQHAVKTTTAPQLTLMSRDITVHASCDFNPYVQWVHGVRKTYTPFFTHEHTCTPVHKVHTQGPIHATDAQTYIHNNNTAPFACLNKKSSERGFICSHLVISPLSLVRSIPVPRRAICDAGGGIIAHRQTEQHKKKWTLSCHEHNHIRKTLRDKRRH